VTVDSYGLRGLFNLECPADADTKLDKCLSMLAHYASFDLLPENCG
jgi:hypothetical protein